MCQHRRMKRLSDVEHLGAYSGNRDARVPAAYATTRRLRFDPSDQRIFHRFIGGLAWRTRTTLD